MTGRRHAGPRPEPLRDFPAGSTLGAAPLDAPVSAPWAPPAHGRTRRSLPLHAPPIVLGLLGGIASGKSHVAGRLAALAGAAVVDADREARRALEAAADDGRLAEAIGPDLLRPDGTPDRAAIARRVFDDEAALQRLEALIHPLVLEHIETRVRIHREGPGPALLVLDVPLLMERGLDTLCDALWFVETPDTLRFERAAARGLSPDEIRRRERRQVPLVRKRERADLVLHNDADLDPQLRQGLAALGLPSFA